MPASELALAICMAAQRWGAFYFRLYAACRCEEVCIAGSRYLSRHVTFCTAFKPPCCSATNQSHSG